MDCDKIKVLYIAGFPRSGSTILGNTLGAIDGFFAAGELSRLWEPGRLINEFCGCGTALKECAVWRTVLDEAWGGGDHIDLQEMARLRKYAIRLRHIPWMLLPGGKQLLTSRPRPRKYLKSLGRLYQAIQSSTQCKVIIDASKGPHYGYALGLIPTIDLHVVHLIRDPRAVAFSRLRKKPDPRSGKYSTQHKPTQSAVQWVTNNLLVEVFWRRSSERYLLLRYEDFIDCPQDTVRRILSLVHEQAPALPFEAERTVALKTNHAVAGNWGYRFQTGTVELQQDDEWKSNMLRPHKTIVTMLTWPLLLRYGYPVLLGSNHSKQCPPTTAREEYTRPPYQAG